MKFELVGPVGKAPQAGGEMRTAAGQKVRSWFWKGKASPFTWDGKDENRQAVSSGVYFCRLIAGGSAIRIRKLVLVR